MYNEIFSEQTSDFVYPEDELEPEQNHYREASRRFLRIMNMQAYFIEHSESKTVARWATNYALGLAICEGVSISDRALQIGISPCGLAKQIKEFQSQIDLNYSPYTYKKSI